MSPNAIVGRSAPAKKYCKLVAVAGDDADAGKNDMLLTRGRTSCVVFFEVTNDRANVIVFVFKKNRTCVGGTKIRVCVLLGSIKKFQLEF